MFIADTSQRTFIGVSTLLFAASAALTVACCGSMSVMHDMPMPGGWSMSMMWMRMPGQSLPASASTFLGMWLVMMVAMMLPSLLPMLWRYRRGIGYSRGMRDAGLTMLVGSAYFAVWTLFGALAFIIGTTLAELEMQSPALARVVPVASGVVVLIAGALQFSAWKSHHLACCRNTPACCDALRPDPSTAWRHGLRLGLHCVHCCFGLTMILLVIGVMDLRAMAVVTAAISAERMAPAGERTARVIGVIAMIAGVFLIGRAALFE